MPERLVGVSISGLEQGRAVAMRHGKAMPRAPMENMIMKRHSLALRGAAGIIIMALAPASLQAATIVGSGSLPGGNKIYLPSTNQTGVGPITFSGATWSSNSPSALFGWTGGFTYTGGSVAAGGEPVIAVNVGKNPGDTYADMFLRFPTATSGFLAELFWTNDTSGPVSGFMGAYNSSGTLLDYFELNNNGSLNGRTPGYLGFSRATADIAYIRFSNSFVVARNMTWIGPEINPPTLGGIPEPAAWAFMILGFSVIGGALRKRKERARVAVRFD
jgi:hypothetical protein